MRAHVRRGRARAARRVPGARPRRSRRAGRAQQARRGAGFRRRWCAAGAASRIAYRKRMVDSPAYRLNHEEVIKALEEGIVFAENLNPIEAHAGRAAARCGDDLQREGQGGRTGGGAERRHAAGADVLVAAGTSPNITYEKERRARFSSTRRRSSSSRTRACNGRRRLAADARSRRLLHLVRRERPIRHLLRRQPSALRRQRRQGDGVGEGRVSRRSPKLFARELASSIRPHRRSATPPGGSWSRGSTTSCSRGWSRSKRLTPTIVEVIVQAPAAARHFHPGQFYRLQNFESMAPCAPATRRC